MHSYKEIVMHHGTSLFKTCKRHRNPCRIEYLFEHLDKKFNQFEVKCLILLKHAKNMFMMCNTLYGVSFYFA